jgi:hypothetical protein
MDKLDFTSIPTHFGDARVAAVRPGEARTHSPIECRTHYVNNLSVDVTVVLRSGLRFRLEPVPNMSSNRLIIRTTVTVDQTVRNDVERVLSTVNEHSTAEMQAMRNAFVQQNQGNTYRGATMILDYPLSFDELRSYGGSIYHKELDCVVSLRGLDEAPLHPHSEAGIRSQTVIGSPVEHGGPSFAYAVEIVDNFGREGPRYMNMSGQIYKITPKKDPERRDGIYIVTNKPNTGDIDTDGVICNTHYPFSLAESDLGLYKSYSEALNLGDISTARKEELANLEHTNRVLAAEMQGLRQQHEREMIEQQNNLKRLELERDRLSLTIAEQEQKMARERLELKDHYEKLSYERKDSSEILKVLPSIVVGIGAIFMAIKTFYPAKLFEGWSV